MAKAKKQGIPQNRNRAKGGPKKGQRVSRATEFKPGESGNPGGRPKKSPVTDAHRAMLEMVNPKDKQKRTYAECLAAALMQRALNGELNVAVEITDRVEGKSVARTELTGKGGDDLFPRLSREENESRIAQLLAGAR